MLFKALFLKFEKFERNLCEINIFQVQIKNMATLYEVSNTEKLDNKFNAGIFKI